MLWESKRLINKVRYSYVLICIGAAIIIIIKCIIDTVTQSGALYLMDDWGSGRGYIWKNSMQAFSRLPFINKIFGSGQATTAYVLTDYATVHSNIFNRTRIDNVHNIWLNILLNMGIAGLLSYISLIGLSVYKTLGYIKKDEADRSDNKMPDGNCLVAAFGLAVIVYSIQGSAELFETLTFPMFFCLMAILNTRNYDMKI